MPTTKQEYQKKYKETHRKQISEKSKIRREKNRDKILEDKRKYRESHREELAAKSRIYWHSHKEEQLEKQKLRRSKQKELIKIKGQKYYKDNLDKIKVKAKEYVKTPSGKQAIKRHTHKRRAQKQNVENSLTLEQWNKILKEQKNKCAICNRKFNAKLKPSQDHIIPLSKGGGYFYGNIQALCKRCNSTKKARIDKGYIIVWTEPILVGGL